MFRNPQKFILSISTLALPLVFSGMVLAQESPSAAVEQGAMAYSNWTKTDAGGTGALPAGVDSKDYIRCKACHGWDHLGTDGGYARRSRQDSRPNAGAGDGDTTTRVIPGTVPVAVTNNKGTTSKLEAAAGPVTAAMITHDGTGRAYTDGMASWVALADPHSAANKAAHSNGYTLGNQHPDLTAEGGLTQAQIDNLVEFLNFDDGKPGAYFSNVNPSQNPVLYTIVDTADAAAGLTYYNSNCMFCHGDPATDHNGLNGGYPGGGILAYLASDGKFSEFAHKARWGIPNTIMNRATIGSPTSQNIADVMLYLQELGGYGLAMNPGHSGHWWGGSTRDGEGFLIEVSVNALGETILTVSFYAHDSLGNQVWLIGSGKVTGNSVELTMTIPEGGLWGDDLVPGDVVRTVWGTGLFTLTSCGAGHILLTPAVGMMNFTVLEYDINRDLTTPGITCPTPTG